MFKHALPPFYQEITSKEHLLPSNNLSLLMLVQHYGLPTRLIDWSLNPLVALYFAVEKAKSKEDKEKAVVYIYSPNSCDVHFTADELICGIDKGIREGFTDKTLSSNENRFVLNAKLSTFNLRILSTDDLTDKIHEDIYITPYLFDKRMQAQSCMFTFSKDMLKPFPSAKLKKIIIENPYQVKADLLTLNVAMTNIYPSISSLCESIIFEKFNPNRGWSS